MPKLFPTFAAAAFAPAPCCKWNLSNVSRGPGHRPRLFRSPRKCAQAARLCKVSRDGRGPPLSFALPRARPKRGTALRDRTTPQLSRPSSFWEVNHYIVVEGIGRKKVFVNDPASGRRTSKWPSSTVIHGRDDDLSKGSRLPPVQWQSAWRSLRRRLRGQTLVLFSHADTLALVPEHGCGGVAEDFFDSILNKARLTGRIRRWPGGHGSAAERPHRAAAGLFHAWKPTRRPRPVTLAPAAPALPSRNATGSGRRRCRQ
jgi:hypothetical protein